MGAESCSYITLWCMTQLADNSHHHNECAPCHMHNLYGCTLVAECIAARDIVALGAVTDTEFGSVINLQNLTLLLYGVQKCVVFT